MDQETCKKLSVGQERLLLKVLDKEACVFERFRAKLLLMVSAEAEVFLDSMRRVREETKNLRQEKMEGSLWEKIDARIDQEERAAVFLGRRPVVIQEDPTSSWFSLGMGNLSGAVVAASVVASLFIARDMMNQELPGARFIAQRASVEGSELLVKPVRAVQSEAPRVTPQLVRYPMEFESMRSDGEISFLRENPDENPVILVRIAPHHLEELELLDNRRNEPRIIEPQIPTTVQVRDFNR